MSVYKHVRLVLLIIVQMVIVIIKVIILLRIVLRQVFSIAFILRVRMVCIVWAIISWILCPYFTLLSLNSWLIFVSIISSKLFIWMIGNIWIIKLSYWFFLHKSVMIALIFKIGEFIKLLLVYLIALKVWKVLILMILEIKAIIIIVILLLKAILLHKFLLIDFFIVLKLT